MISNLTRLRVRNICDLIMSKSTVVFVLGGPGAGKGTQCAKIVEHFGYVHLSAGDLLRAERNNSESKEGKLINDHIKNGTIVPVEITCGLLKKAMEKASKEDDKKNKFLIDGFPRNQDNLNGWNKVMNDTTDLKFVLHFDCPEATCIERIQNRGKTSGRVDDNMESLKKRFHTFRNETKPILDHYTKLEKVRTVEADKSPEEVFKQVEKLFSE